jgi:TPR repeat protein
MNDHTASALPSSDEVSKVLQRRRKGEVDLTTAVANIDKVSSLRASASHGDLIATAQLLEVASMCGGGAVDLSGKNDFSACRAALGVQNSLEMERLTLGLIRQLASAGYEDAKLEFAQRVLIVVEERRLNNNALVVDADQISRAKAFLIELADAGVAEGAFRLAQIYLKGVSVDQDKQLGLKYAQLARQRDPERFENVELMLGI